MVLFKIYGRPAGFPYKISRHTRRYGLEPSPTLNILVVVFYLCGRTFEVWFVTTKHRVHYDVYYSGKLKQELDMLLEVVRILGDKVLNSTL